MPATEESIGSSSGGTANRRRNRSLKWGVATSIASRGMIAATPLLTVPVTLDYLGMEPYGAWATAASITALLIFADLGIGTGLMTKLGRLRGDGDAPAAQRLVSSGYAVVATISAVLVLCLVISWPITPWAELVGSGEIQDPAMVSAVTAAVFVAFALNMTCSLIVRVQYGLQLSPLANLWQLAGALVNVAVVYAVAAFDPGALLFILALTCTPLVVALMNTLVFFSLGDGRRIRPRISAVSTQEIGTIIRLGARFLVISALMAIALSLDPWIVAKVTTLADVPTYAIPVRVFALVGAVVTTVTVPLWPANAQAIAAGETEWVRRWTRRMVPFCLLLAALPAVVVVVVAPAFVEWWLGGEIVVSQTLLISLAIWWMAQAALSPLFMVQNGAEVVKPQIIGYAIFLISLPLKFVVAQHVDVDFIPLAGALLYLAILGPAALIGYRRALSVARLNAHMATRPAGVDLVPPVP